MFFLWEILWKCFANWMKTYWLCDGNGDGDGDDDENDDVNDGSGKENNVVDVRHSTFDTRRGRKGRPGLAEAVSIDSKSFDVRTANTCIFAHICIQIPHAHVRTHIRCYLCLCAVSCSGIWVTTCALFVPFLSHFPFFEYVSFEIVPLQFA